MKKNFIACLLLLLLTGLYGCSSGDIEMAKISISSRDVATGSLITGGQYRVLNSSGEVVATYTLTQGTVDVTNLRGANYTIEEVAAPAGYVNVSSEASKKYVYFNNNSEDFVFLYVNEETRELPSSVDLKFYSEEDGYYGDYTAIRIGEYYWINKNFTHTVSVGATFENSYPITQALLDKYLPLIDMNTSSYQLSDINDFEKYYGRYYSYASILSMNQNGYMVNEYNQKEDDWRLPVFSDYRQLFAMCPFNTSHDPVHTILNERDVRFTLAPKPNDNPLAYNIYNGSPYDIYWFDSVNNTGLYGFGLMPGGARLNGPSEWCNGLGCYNGVIGDFHSLFYTAYLAAIRPDDSLAIGAVVIEDHVDTKDDLLYHFMNVRWCRPLTDTELGYKLYINSAQTDIQKLSLTDAVPDGYTELPHGYVRGFYVQYLLDNTDTALTVSDIVGYARSVDDNYVAGNNSNTSIIF